MFRVATLLVVCLAARAAVAEPIRLPGGQSLQSVDFERHVAPLLSRLGCNSGSCHGSFEGKGGLRLSLFGYDPAADHAALAGDRSGRIDRDHPDASLLLRKITARVEHGGGKRIEADAWQYHVLREWIDQGALHRPGTATVVRLHATPEEIHLARPSSSSSVRVQAEFADGTEDDVTSWCEFRMQDDAVASVSAAGLVRGIAAGDTAVIATYGPHATSARVSFPIPEADAIAWPDIPMINVVDEHIFAKVRSLRIAPSPLTTDEEFLRRLTLTTTGQLPTPEEARTFLADTRPDKRLQKIDELLAHPLHAALWATRYSEITGNSTESLEGPAELQSKRAKMWHDWLRRRFAANVPYDELVRDILCATSRSGRPMREWIADEAELTYAARKGFTSDYADRETLDLFWRRDTEEASYPTEEMAERVAAAFLGVRIACARCHKHPFDRWTQNDYRAFANVFAQIRFDMSPELRATLSEMLEERRRQSSQVGETGRPLPRVREVYVSERPHDLRAPDTNEILPPKPLGGPGIDAAGDRRHALADWLTAADNPYFAVNIVNRVWAHYFGWGLVEPVDGFSAANPPSHPELLEALAADFVEHGYDLRRLERMILRSSTWQLSSEPNGPNAADRRNFARAYVRTTPAETVIDMLHAALGTRPDFGDDVPPGIRAVEIAPSRLGDARWDRLLSLFGRSRRTSVCDCERQQDPTIRQVLFVMSDPQLLGDIKRGRLQDLLCAGSSDDEVVEELFLATLSRFPTYEERSAALKYVGRSDSREAALADVLWGLVNTLEFVTNH